ELVDHLAETCWVVVLLAHHHSLTRCASEPWFTGCESLLLRSNEPSACSRPCADPVYPDQPMRLPTKVRVGPQAEVKGSLSVPGSKSITNRALLLAALAEGESTVQGALMAEDSRVMIQALQALGVGVEVSKSTVVVAGAGGPFPASEAELDLRLSGTSIRFLTAALALGRGRFTLDGNERMRERPIAPLLSA